MTFFDNLKNKLFKEENSGKGKDSQPAEKSKNLQNKIKGLFAKKPDEVEQAVEDLDMSQESQETSRYQRSKQKKPIDTTQPLGKVQAFLNKFTLSPRNPIRRFLRRYHIGKILFILVAMLVLTVGSYLFYIAKTTNVSDLQDALKATTVIYDKEGNQAGSLSGQKGTYVELDAISDSLENAVIATEDRTFYENSGVNVKRFLLAIVSMGRFGGGSTITQQLAKNAFFCSALSFCNTKAARSMGGFGLPIPMRRRGNFSDPTRATIERMPLWLPALPPALMRMRPRSRSISSYITRSSWGVSL